MHFLAFFVVLAQAQFPFEKFAAPAFKVTEEWTRYDKGDGKYHWTMTFDNFYKDSSSMTVQITEFPKSDTSLFRIYKNKKQIQTFKEPYPVGSVLGILQDSTRYGDINGDSLTDVKIQAWCGGNGIAAYLFRNIYLFQRRDGTFSKVSFNNMEFIVANAEHDLDADGNFEIVTTTLEDHEDHNYWTFNLYRFDNERLLCVNDEFDYPIMVQYLYRKNYRITEKISRKKMKDFARRLPEDFSPNY